MNTRPCPICNKKLLYKNKYTRNQAEKKQTLCSICSRLGEKNPMYKSV